MAQSKKNDASRKSAQLFIDAVITGQVETVAAMLKAGVDVHAFDPKDRQKRTPLHHAAIDGNVALARTLLEHGADPNARDANGWTPLHFSAQRWDVEMGGILLEEGAAVDAVDVHGNTPLSRAVFESCGRGEFILLLLKAKADPHLQNSHGVSPWSLAQNIGNYDVKRYFS